MDRVREYILCSAVWYKDFDNYYPEQVKEQSRPKNIERGIVICGQRHLQCIRTFSFIAGKRSVESECGEYEQGFLTNTNRFVGREEAGKIAFEAGQTDELHTTLYSENLY